MAPPTPTPTPAPEQQQIMLTNDGAGLTESQKERVKYRESILHRHAIPARVENWRNGWGEHGGMLQGDQGPSRQRTIQARREERDFGWTGVEHDGIDYIAGLSSPLEEEERGPHTMTQADWRKRNKELNKKCIQSMQRAAAALAESLKEREPKQGPTYSKLFN